MHGIHHSQVEAEAMSNYGVLLPWWDRLHRTLRLDVPQGAITIGVPGFSPPHLHNSDNGLLNRPFASGGSCPSRFRSSPIVAGIAAERRTAAMRIDSAD